MLPLSTQLGYAAALGYWAGGVCACTSYIHRIYAATLGHIRLGDPEQCHNQLDCFQLHCILLYFIELYYTLKFWDTTGNTVLLCTTLYWYIWCGILWLWYHSGLNCLTPDSTGVDWVLTVLHWIAPTSPNWSLIKINTRNRQSYNNTRLHCATPQSLSILIKE